MAAGLEVPQDAQKSTARAMAPVPWHRKPLSTGLALALGFATTATGVLVGIDLWRGGARGEAAPQRWSTADETWSDCYKDLLTQKPLMTACVHNESGAIDPRPFDWVKPHVAVYSTVAPPHPSPTLHDLGDAGQAQAIGFLEKDGGLKGRAWADLKDALGDSDASAGERDPFRFDRVLVANVAKGVDWMPGDRMIWTRVLIQPINFDFAGYSVAATDNETQKVSSVEKTDSRKFSADLSATIPGMEGPKASLEPSSEHSVKTSSDINAQYEKLGIDIMPNFLRIMRESETGGDAVGNTEVALTAVTDAETIWRRYPNDKLGPPSDEDPIVLMVTATHVDGDGPDDQAATDPKRPAVDIVPRAPVPHCALRARVWMIYEERRVDSGRESYDESKQAVTLAHDAEDKQDVDIVSADEVSPAVWSLRVCENPDCRGEETRYLKAMVQTKAPIPANAGRWRKVVFTDYGVAMRLAHWLRTTQNSTPANTEYRFNYPSDTDGTYVSLLPVKTTKDECKPESREQMTGR